MVKVRETMDAWVRRVLDNFPDYGCTMSYMLWLAMTQPPIPATKSALAERDAEFRAAWARSRKNRVKVGYQVGNASRWILRSTQNG